MSDDEDILVERDELCHDRMNGMLINVAPFNGLENIGYGDDEINESDVGHQQALRKETSEVEESDFIMALFVVVFDTKHGMCYLYLQRHLYPRIAIYANPTFIVAFICRLWS